jgi:thiamine pyrophosphokinase
MLLQQLIRLTTILFIFDKLALGRSFVPPKLLLSPQRLVVRNKLGLLLVRMHTTTATANTMTMTTAPKGKSNDHMVVQKFTSPLLDQETTHKTALIVLNYPMQSPPSSLFTKLWALSSGHICADGGANRLYEATTTTTTPAATSTTTTSKYCDDYIPDLIRGDLDSLAPHVRQYYQELGVRIELDPCQDTNDLDKALQVCHKAYSRILVFGAFGGRFDQEMASFQALYKWGPAFDNQVFLYADETMGFLIPANVNVEIRLPYFGEEEEENASTTTSTTATTTTTHDDMEMGEGPTCGLIPLGGRVDSITTAGLKWDLDGTIPLEFGKLVSTSNRMMQSVVTVESSHPVVFTAEVLVRPTKPNNQQTTKQES